MYPFSPSVTPAIRTHLDAQVNFFNDMSRSLSRSFQHMCELNMQLGQTLLEEGNIAGQRMLTSDTPTDAISAAACRAQPATEKLRAYQQHISRVVADTQVDLARVGEQHVQETSRTARDLAEQVARCATEENDKAARAQQQTMNSLRDPFADGRRSGNGSASMQRAGSEPAEGHFDSHPGSMQGHQQPANAKAGKAS